MKTLRSGYTRNNNDTENMGGLDHNDTELGETGRSRPLCTEGMRGCQNDTGSVSGRKWTYVINKMTLEEGQTLHVDTRAGMAKKIEALKELVL